MTDFGDAPAPNEIELSLFGPGYGEAIALHLGDGKWILVDSCLEPQSGHPATLAYLTRLGVTVEDAVQLVVATHWHDDHIRGIGALFRACRNADLVISGALNDAQILKFAGAERLTLRSSGIDELSEIYRLLTERKEPKARFATPKFAHADRLLFRTTVTGSSEPIEIKVFALSPADASILQAHLALAQLLPQVGERKKRIISLPPNHTSVVLWVEIGVHRILLGGDLENTSDPKTGWTVIVTGSTVVNGKSSAFKIPHHGSQNAHHDGVWSELLEAQPFAVVSPFRNGRQMLPTPADIERILAFTSNGYATAPARARESRWQHSTVRRTIREVTRTMRSHHEGWGHVRLRRVIEDTKGNWRVQLFGDAYSLRIFATE